MSITKFYDFSKLLSYNGVYNHAVGGRGIGKTYGAKKKVTRAAIKSGFNDGEEKAPGFANEQFIYLRRYKKELQIARDTFFSDYQKEFPYYDFRTTGYEAQCAPVSTRDEKKRKWYTIGYFIALSVAQTYKSASFPLVKTIIFDEYIIEKGSIHYLPDEAKVFNNFFSTVDRYKDKTRVLFLANSVSITNPYFIEYKIEPAKADESGIIKSFNNFMIVHIIDSEQFANEVYQTRFGAFIQGTEYGDYAVGNEFFDNNEMLLGGKIPTAMYLYTLETRGATFSVWYDTATAMFYAQTGRPGNEIKLTMIPERMDHDKTLVSFSDKSIARLRTAYRHGNMRFDKPAVRNAFMETFKR